MHAVHALTRRRPPISGDATDAYFLSLIVS
jgi:hypothetical protein